MALWEIRLANQNPIRVDVEDETRNLCAEYEAFSAEQPSRWAFWKRDQAFWKVTDDVLIHRDLVAGVLLKKPKPDKGTIGF